MPEELLHTAKVGTVVEHVRGEAVPQGMRADRRVQPGLPEVLVHLAAHTAGAEPLAVLVGEQDLAVEAAVVLHPLVTIFDVLLNRLQGLGADRRDPLLLALAADVDDLAKK